MPQFNGTTYVASYPLWNCGDPAKTKIVPEADYGLNEWIIASPTTLASIESPASIGLGEDSTYIYDGPSVCVSNKLYFINAIEAFGGPIDWWGNSIRHTGGNNFFYCDGHSKWSRPSGLQAPGTPTFNAGAVPASPSNPASLNTSATKFGYWPVQTTDVSCSLN
jgi:prepilin-type processing-associated H-X9-DG protein